MLLGARGTQEDQRRPDQPLEPLDAVLPGLPRQDNSPNIWYSIAVSGNTAEDDLTGPLSTWMDCLHDFDSFVDNPEEFLKSHSD